MRKLMLAIAVLWLVAPAGTAAAQSPDDAAESVSRTGFYLGPGTEISETEAGDLVARARDAGLRFFLVVLDEEPAGGATVFAGAVFDEVGAPGTVLVLTEDGFIGYETAGELGRSQIEDALDLADERGGSDLTYLGNVVDALLGDITDSPGSGGGGSSSGLWILVLIVAAGVAVVWFVVRRSSRAARERAEHDVESARAEIQKQLNSMADDILDLADRVELAGDAEAAAHYEAGSATYAEASEEFERAGSIGQLEALADRLDEAAWQLDAAQAILAGEPVPPKPERETARCFFDPTHRGPMVEATVRTSAGDRSVLVCRDDADKLERGEHPDPRMIDVGGRRVPAPAAPRSHGGGGFRKSDMAAIVLGELATRLPDLLGGRGGFGGPWSRGSPGRGSTGGRRRGPPGGGASRSRGGRRRGR